jgi:hypothetical protein
MRTYERLGKDKPQESVEPPLSPKEPVAGGTQQTIDVNPTGPDEGDESGNIQEQPQTQKGLSQTHSATDAKALLRRAKGRNKNDDTARKPYEGLFEATIKSSATSPTIEITDLRENITDGQKKWTESLFCLVCGTEVE